jgi:hypothetical protein
MDALLGRLGGRRRLVAEVAGLLSHVASSPSHNLVGPGIPLDDRRTNVFFAVAGSRSVGAQPS